MSLVTTTALKVAPSNSAGVSLTGGGTSWTAGAWVELIAVTPDAIQIAGLMLATFSSGSASNEFWSIAFAIGASGSEVLIAEYAFYYPNSGAAQDRGIRLPVPLSGIPIGSRVSVRLRNTAAVATVNLEYYQGLDSDHASAASAGFLPATSGSTFGVSITPSGSAFANSAYIQLTAGLSTEISLATVALQNTLASTEWELELATGGAGAEVPITMIRESSTSSGFGGPKMTPLPGIYPIGPTIRIAARLRKSGTSTVAKFVSVNYLGTTLAGIPDPTGDGDPGTGTDPAADTSLCGAKILTLWGELELDASTARWSRAIQPLNHPSAYHGGPKEPRILSLGLVKHQLSDWTGRLVTNGLDITVEDTDGAVRALIAANTLRNKNFQLFVIDDTDGRASLVPHQGGCYVVQNWTLIGDLSVRLTLAPRLGVKGISLNLTKQLSMVPLDTTTFPGLPTELIGKSAPWPYGIGSDESQSPAVGTAPVWYVGPITMADGNIWYGGLIAGCATKGPISVFGSNGGDPVSRVKLDSSIYSTDIAFPQQGQWTTVTGVSTNYVVRNSRRWTMLFVKPGSVVGEAFKDNSVPLVVNLGGIEDVGDSTGDVITSLPLQLVHLLTNCVLQDPPGDANWLTIPQIGSPAYSIISTSTFQAVKTLSETRVAGGYIGSFIISHDLSSLSVEDWIARILLGGDFNLFVNRHGQICASMEDGGGTATKSFDAITDIVDGSYSAPKDWGKWANKIVWSTIKRYPPAANSAFLYDTTEWLFAKDVNDDGTLQGLQRDTQIFEYEDWVTRDFTLAIPDDVGGRKLQRMRKAPDYPALDVDLCGTDLGPGDYFNYTHFAGPVATVRKCRVDSVSVDYMQGRTTLVGHDMADL